MAANMDALIRIAARVDGANTIQAFSRDLKGLDGAAKISGGSLQRMNGVINRMAREAGNTTSGIRAHITALENLRSRVEIGGNAYNRLGAQVDQLRGKLRGLDGEAKQSGLGVSRVVSDATGALLAGAGVAGAGATIGLIARAGIDAETARVRLKALTEQFGEYNQAQAAAARIAQTLRISQTEAADSFSKLYAALRPTGVTLQEVEDAFIGFTAAARASGSTAAESSAALLQLKQALGSGVLQGDELRSIREQAPAAAQAIAREMGVTIGELKKLGSEGKITTDIVLRALARLKGESLGKLNAQFNTSAQALQDLRVSADQFGQTIARVFGPAAVATVRGLGAAIREVNAVMGALTGDGGAQGRVQDMQRARAQAQQDTDRRPFGMFDAQGKQSFFQQRTQQLFQQFQRRRADQASRAAAASGASAGQLAERQAAERERMLGRQRAAAGAAAGGGAKTEADASQQLAQKAARERIELDNTLHQNAIELIRKRYEYERELQNQSADNWVKRYTGAARSAAGIISGALRGFDDLTGRQREADVGVLNARQALGSAQRQGAIGAAAGGGLGMANFTASQLQAATKEASRFTGVANMCSESVKAFYKSLGITLPGVTAWADTVRKAGKTMTDWSQLRAGDIVATGRPGDTPHVGVYTGGDSVFHQSRSRGLRAGNYPDLNYFKQGGYFVRPSAMAGASGARPGPAGDAMQASANLAQAKAMAALEKGQVDKLKSSIGEGFVLDFTDQLRQQNAELENQNAITQLRNRLQMEGVRPEIIEAEALKTQKIREVAQETGVATDALKALEAADYGGSAQANRLREAIALQNENLLIFKTRTNEATAAQIAFNDAMRFRQDTNIGAGLREGAQGYIESIGTMRAATAELAQNGIGGVENALTSLATTGKANFREFAVDMLKQTTRLIIQQVVLRSVLQAIGAIGGGGGSALGGGLSNAQATNFSFNPGAMTGGAPWSFAGGGYTGNAPRAGGLDGKGGFMAMLHPQETVIDHTRAMPRQGASNPINVVVNVDAKGTAVEGNQTEGAELGRAISAAVQAEIIKQQRPGGRLASTRR